MTAWRGWRGFWASPCEAFEAHFQVVFWFIPSLPPFFGGVFRHADTGVALEPRMRKVKRETL